jgi:hypothetical protein
MTDKKGQDKDKGKKKLHCVIYIHVLNRRWSGQMEVRTVEDPFVKFRSGRFGLLVSTSEVENQ